MRRADRRRARLPYSWSNVTLMLGALATASACVGDETQINVTYHLVTNEQIVPAGFSCMPIGEYAEASNGSKGSPFWVNETWISEGFAIRWGAFHEELGARFFDFSYFEDHEFERFFIIEPNGDEHVYAVWGAASCETCPSEHLDEYVDYPGAMKPCRVAELEPDASVAVTDGEVRVPVAETEPDAGSAAEAGAGIPEARTRRAR